MTLHIVTPAKAHVHGKFVQCINQTLCSDLSRQLNTKVSFELFLGKSNIVQARSIALTRWYDNSEDGDMFLFIDSDHVFTNEDIVKIATLKDCDVACGIYPNHAGTPTAFAVDLEAFLDNYRDNRLLYAGTGFMLIHRSICTKIIEHIHNEHGFSRVCNDGNHDKHIVPFFRSQFIDSENGIEPLDVKHWLGEDFSFCWLVRQCGGVIRGFLSQTLGHEVMHVRNFYPDNFHSVM